MADILIRGMEMPKTCSQCPMCQDYVMCKLNSFAFWNTNNPFDFRNERLAGCPLIELPEHGDLIDLDERLTGIIYDEHKNDTYMVTMAAREWLGSVDDIPTVIVPSNKEETE